MERRKFREYKLYISPERKKEIEHDKETRMKERIRIAQLMMAHNEPDEKISLYTQFSLEEIKVLRETEAELKATEKKRKTEAMLRGLSFRNTRLESENVREVRAVL